MATPRKSVNATLHRALIDFAPVILVDEYADTRSGSGPMAPQRQLPECRARGPWIGRCTANSHTMNAQTYLSSADLTTPLLSPEILSSFEALSDGCCSLSELNLSVLDACRDDPIATAGVLLLLEGYANSGELDQYDFHPLKRELQRRQGIQDPVPEIDVVDPTRASVTATPIANDHIDEAFAHSSDERVHDCPENDVVATAAERNTLRGRYILEEEIGRGGVGTVYRALDLNRTALPREHHYVALKVLRTEHARRADALDALRREYHQAQLLSHPGIVNVFDFDHDGGTYFVTMELLDGEALGALIRRTLPNKLPLEAASRILRELGDAVAYAHDRGVLHLDLKPDNVMVDAQGHVRVLDFGLAQTHRAEPWIPEMESSPPAATLAYASCERLVQERPDVRDDIFSFSCLAYEVLTGKHPFDRYSALRARKEGRTARRIRELSRRQWRVLKSGLAWAREDRPANMRELLEGLALQSSKPRRGVEWQPVAAVAMLVLGTAAVLSWNRLLDRSDGEPSHAAPIDVKPASEAEAGNANQTTPEALAAAAAPPQGGSATAAPSKADFAPAIETTSPGAEPPSPPTEPVETTDVNPAPTHSSSEPTEVAAAGQTPPVASTPTAEDSDVLGFTRHSFSVSEADSVARLSVRRLGGAASEISFQWHTVDDSAKAGEDYVLGTGEEVMTAGQTTATLMVPIVADSNPEYPELLQVVIGNSRGARVGSASRVPVIIVDDD